jgi:hypothetical protein
MQSLQLLRSTNEMERMALVVKSCRSSALNRATGARGHEVKEWVGRRRMLLSPVACRLTTLAGALESISTRHNAQQH